MKTRQLYIGSDHAGYDLKEHLKPWLQEIGYEIDDKGCYSEESVDYPEFAHLVASAVEDDSNSLGIVICGSGNGVSMAANKHMGIRSALCWNSEVATLARGHNNANIIALPARFISLETAKEIMYAFLETSFQGGRHERRIEKINLQTC